MNDIKIVISMIRDRLKKLAQSNAVVSRPISVGDRHVLPLCELSIGFGGAGGEGDQQFGCRSGHRGGKGKGSGAGGAAKVRPVGVVVFTEDGVTVEKIPDRLSPIEKVFEKVPELIDRFNKHR